MQSLLNEAKMYEKLKEYWGKFVPNFLTHEKVGENSIDFLATELVEGMELGEGRFHVNS